jgi:hypothetical protein
MSNVNFCTKSYTKTEVIEEVKIILVLPDLHTTIEKYNSLTDEDQQKKFLNKKIYNQAQRKWHPDRWRYNKSNITSEKADFYSKCISDALEIFKIIAKNPDYFAKGTSENINFGDKEQTDDASLAEMQEKLRNAIDKIFEKAKKTTEEVVLNKGTLYRDIIQEEQSAKVYVPTFYAIVFYIILLMAELIRCPEMTPVSLIIRYFITFLIFICFLYLIPFSRYWLFSKIPHGELICGTIIVDLGSLIFTKLFLLFNKLTEKLGNSQTAGGFFVTMVILSINIQLITFQVFIFIFGCVMWIFYEIALLIVKDKRFKDITKEQTFYDGVAEWYIYEMIAKPVSELTANEKQIIKYFYVSYL